MRIGAKSVEYLKYRIPYLRLSDSMMHYVIEFWIVIREALYTLNAMGCPINRRSLMNRLVGSVRLSYLMVVWSLCQLSTTFQVTCPN
jgi:hypothetical protein